MLIFFIICIIVLLRRKRLELELLQILVYKDEIMKECKQIRHEYNNMLQTIIGLVEEDDLESLKLYKEKILVTTNKINKNNFAQLVKISDKYLFSIIYKLIVISENRGIILNLTIYNDIDDNIINISYLRKLSKYINYAYELAVKDEKEINLKISKQAEGFSFIFTNSIHNDPKDIISYLNTTKKALKPNKKIIFNTLIENDLLIQEILLLITQ
jgi:sensor histidine kinase regulating citrate/malate metabolism